MYLYRSLAEKCPDVRSIFNKKGPDGVDGDDDDDAFVVVVVLVLAALVPVACFRFSYRKVATHLAGSQ